MKRFFLSLSLAVLVGPSLSLAQARVPSGCFVTDAERDLYLNPPTCFNEARLPILPYSPDNGNTKEQILNYYGFQYGFEINTSYDLFYKWQDAEARVTANKSAADTHYGWYVSEFNRGKKLKALESKLRSACGSKCRRIATIRSLGQPTPNPQSSGEPTKESRPLGVSFEDYLSRLGS